MLFRSDEIIHPDCTTAIETSFLGKLPISYMPKNYSKDIVTKIPLEVSLNFSCISQIIDYLQKNKQFSINKNKRQQILNDYFSYSQPATQLIINKLKEIRSSHDFITHKKNLRKQFFLLKVKEIYNHLRKNKDFNFTQKKLEGFNFENIKEIQNIIFKNEGLKKAKLKKYNKHLIIFKKNNDYELRNDT